MKKFLISIIVVTAVIFGSGWLIQAAKNNLHQYAYYYASHMERRKHDYPAINMTNYVKFNHKLLSGYDVSVSGPNRKSGTYNTEFIKRNVVTSGDIVLINRNYGEVLYYSSLEKLKNFDYEDNDELFSDSAWRNVTPVYNKKLSPHQKVLYQVLDDIENQIKKNSPKPTVNLQWLFDRIYPIWWGY